MSNNGHETGAPDIVPIRKSLRIGPYIIGKPAEMAIDGTLLSEQVEVAPVEPEEVSNVAAMAAALSETAPRVFRERPFTKLTAQRPIVYSGSPFGFFEHEAVREVMGGFQAVTRVSMVPHATVIEEPTVRKILDRHPGISLAKVATECRKVADGLPDRQYGHVKGVIPLGPSVILKLDGPASGRLTEDATTFCEHFGVPLSSEEKTFFPHVRIATAIDRETADQLSKTLNPLLTPQEGPNAKALAFGGATILYG